MHAAKVLGKSRITIYSCHGLHGFSQKRIFPATLEKKRLPGRRKGRKEKCKAFSLTSSRLSGTIQFL